MQTKVKNLIKSKVSLAPMAGITDYVLRSLVRKYSQNCLLTTEMISSEFLAQNRPSEITKRDENHSPISYQISGHKPELMRRAAENLTPIADIIDINMGCPVPKVAIKSQAGSALLKNPSKIKEIVETVVAAVDVPVTVKIRSGWDNNSINAVEVAKICEEAGASAIAVHGRTRSQGYSGVVDLDIIKKVKENVTIPVIGNGDITDIDSAKEMLDYTGCDAIMIGRGVLGNPWLIKEIVSYTNEGVILRKPTYQQKIEMCFKHLDYLLKIKPEKVAVLEMRSHIAWYLKGLPGNVEIKNEVFKAKTSVELEKILNNYLKKLKNSI